MHSSMQAALSIQAYDDTSGNHHMYFYFFLLNVKYIEIKYHAESIKNDSVNIKCLISQSCLGSCWNYCYTAKCDLQRNGMSFKY